MLRWHTVYHLAKYPVLGILALLGLGWLCLLGTRLTNPSLIVRDFTQDYLLVRGLVVGMDPNTPMNELAIGLGYSIDAGFPSYATPHPPTMGLLLLPLGFLSYEMAAEVWLATSFLSLLAIVIVLAYLRGITLRPIVAIAIAIALVTWEPVLSELRQGQVTILLALLLAVMVLFLGVGRHRASGVALGFSLLIKPFAWPIVILLVLRRQWQPLLYAVMTTVVGYTIAAIIVGPSAMIRYFAETGPAVSAIFRGLSHNISLWSTGPRLFGESWVIDSQGNHNTIAPIVAWPEAASVLAVLLPSVALLAGWWFTRRLPLDQAVGVLVCVSILASPVAWTHYLVLCLVPLALTFRRLTPGLLTCLALLLPNYATWITVTSWLGASQFAALMPTLGVIAVATFACSPFSTPGAADPDPAAMTRTATTETV